LLLFIGQAFCFSPGMASTGKTVRKTTLLDLLITIEGESHGRCTEGTLVSTALKLINSGKVKLSGTFANASLPLK
jgi:hypothetical protein